MDQRQQAQRKKWTDLSQAVKQAPMGDMLLVMGDFNTKVSRREAPAKTSSEQLEDSST